MTTNSEGAPQAKATHRTRRSRRIVPAALAVILLAPLPVRAASFDCKKATQVAEKFVCGNPALSRIDEELAAVYRRARERLVGEARDSVQAGQRAWLRYWPLACSAAPRSVKLGAGQVKCAEDEYRRRMEVLVPAEGFLGRFTVYQVASYSARPPFPDVESESAATGVWIFPQIALAGLAGPDLQLASKLNAWLAPPRTVVDEAMHDDGGTLEVSTSLERVTPNILGSTTSRQQYGFGAAHPMSSAEARYYNLQAGRPLAATDVIASERGMQVLADVAYVKLKAGLGEMIQVESAADLRKAVSNPAAWAFVPDGLQLGFNAYEVAPYSAGPQTVVVPWTRLKDWMTDFARAEVAGVKKR